MKDFHGMLLWRHSIRKYTDEEIAPEDVKTIVEAGLLAPTSKNSRSWSFTLVDDKQQLEQLSQCKPQFASPIARCSLAIIVSANPLQSDVWVEDASIAASYMQLQAEALGLGSCWIQVRCRMLDDENTASEAVKAMFNINAEQQVVCVLAIGHKGETRNPANPDKLFWNQVHLGPWNSNSGDDQSF